MESLPSVPPQKAHVEEDTNETPRVLVCVELEMDANRLILPAKIIADALNARLTFLNVIETDGMAGRSPIDPIEWDIKRREANTLMGQLVEENTRGAQAPTSYLLEGRSAEQICGVLAGRPQDIAVLGRGHDGTGSSMGKTARQVLETGENSLLLIPSDVETSEKFARILVPLDCSGRSEQVMPIVEKIARSVDAEVVLVHAIPEPAFTGPGPGEPNDSELKSQINERNERVAHTYVDLLSRRLRASGLRAVSIVFSGGDVRRQLTAAIGEQAIDLLVLSSHGQSGFADVPFGDVTSFLVARSSVPTLLIRIGGRITERHAFSDARSSGTHGPVRQKNETWRTTVPSRPSDGRRQ